MDFHAYEAICKVHAVQYILTNLSPTNLNHHHFEYPKYIDTDCRHLFKMYINYYNYTVNNLNNFFNY